MDDPIPDLTPEQRELLRQNRERLGYIQAPQRPLIRAASYLRMMALGLQDMAGSDNDRVLLAFCGFVVFGRSVTLAMQLFKNYDSAAFLPWYAPWAAEMRGDPLLKFFYVLRTSIVHKAEPPIAILISSSSGVPRPGTITIEGWDTPTMHLGQEITDASMENLCALYLAYLERMHRSFAEIVWPVVDERMAKAQAAEATIT